ncbi:MAG: transcriptional regulator [Hungatella sp.]|jgi:predicted transcriptional regulator YheO|nr:transcriptional regulator [Hungatella sp.]
MEERFEIGEEWLKQILDLLEQQFGSRCEVVLHDLSRPYDSTIIDIRNGHITGRRVGDCGSNLGLEVIRGTVKNGDKFNYFTNTRDGKVLRSSSIYLKDDQGTVRYSLCVNVDITESIRLENYLHENNRYNIGESEEQTEEIFVDNVHDLLEDLLQKGIQFVGRQPSQMNKENKMQLLEFLDRKGAFLISKSGEKVCEVLGISKYTFYNYLETVRKGNGEKTEG